MDNKQYPLVFIIIVNWNAETVTAECLQSLRKLRYPNYRIILVDNGSQDHSGQKLVSRFCEVELIQLDQNQGFTGGNNAGIQTAINHGADYILLLNNDTVVAPDLLNQLINVAESDPKIAIANPKVLFADAPDRIWYAAGTFSLWFGRASYHYREKDTQPPDKPQMITFATGCAMLLRVKSLNKTGLFDERFFAYAEDVDLTVRMIKAGYRAMYVPTARVWHKDGYTVKQQQGFAYKVYLSTRNILLLMAKHASAWQWVVFLPFFCFNHILFFIALSVLRRDLKIAWAVLAGSYAFLHNKDSHFSAESLTGVT